MSDEILSTITAIAGDDNGGPHLKFEIDSRMAADDLTDEAITNARKATMDTFRQTFGLDAEQIVVMVEERRKRA